MGNVKCEISMVRAVALCVLIMGSPSLSQASDHKNKGCHVSKAQADMTHDDALAAWNCIKDQLYTGYNKGNKRWIPADFVKDYKDWKLTNTAPAAPGFHSDRFLVTYVNDVGYDEYTRFADDGSTDMPAGSLIAKESFSVTKKGDVKPGPLFLMQRVEEGISPETDDWYYMMVMPNGSPAAINVYSGCSDCHMGFDYQGNLGYPVEDVRVKR